MSASGKAQPARRRAGTPALLLIHASRSDCLLKKRRLQRAFCAALDTRVNLFYKKWKHARTHCG